MSHRFSEDELDHLTPEEHETAQPEAVKPEAVEPEAAADATQAVRFDPFADEDDDFSEDHHLTASPVQSGGQNAAAPGANNAEASDRTAAVPFDPFADDLEEEDLGATGAVLSPADRPGAHGTATGKPDDGEYVDSDNIAALIEELGQLRDRRKAEDPSRASRRRALDTFRQRRATKRTDREVADGMATLPFVVPVDPSEALIDPKDAPRAAPPQLKPGDMVAGQYEILGVLAHGGLGLSLIHI